MPPVILSSRPAGDGLALVVVSAEPGRRVQLLVTAEVLTGPDAAATISALATLTDRKGTP